MATQTHTNLLEELRELDRLVHRLTERVQKEHPGIAPAYELLHSLKGILKGRLPEDPLVYQRRIRKEDQEHRSSQV